MRGDMCDRIANLLPEYEAGSLSEGDRAKVAAHLERCDACRWEAAALRRTGELLSQTEPRRPTHDLWPGVAAQLSERQTRRAWRVPFGPARRAWSVVAAALMLVILVAGLVVHPPGCRVPVAAPQLVAAADAEAGQYARWHAEASMTGGLADSCALALLVSTGKPVPEEPKTQ